MKNYLAARAFYRAEMPAWELQAVKVVSYDEAGNITQEETADSLMMPQWSETPFRLASSNMRAEFLSLPELRDYLHFNSDFPHSSARAILDSLSISPRAAVDLPGRGLPGGAAWRLVFPAAAFCPAWRPPSASFSR